MCHDTPSAEPRVGARVDLFSRGRKLAGNLLFLDPSEPHSQTATHVRFIPGPRFEAEDPVYVSIHSCGDLTKSARDSGLIRQFCLPLSHDPSEVDMPLDRPLSLTVGRDGIIGRRVSVGEGSRALADGIVGFNSLGPVPASL